MEPTLRDRFAGYALIGLIAGHEYTDGDVIENRAKEAYMYADAMLKERENNKE